MPGMPRPHDMPYDSHETSLDAQNIPRPSTNEVGLVRDEPEPHNEQKTFVRASDVLGKLSLDELNASHTEPHDHTHDAGSVISNKVEEATQTPTPSPPQETALFRFERLHKNEPPRGQDQSVRGVRNVQDGKPMNLHLLYKTRHEVISDSARNKRPGQDSMRVGEQIWSTYDSPLEGVHSSHVRTFASWFEAPEGPLPPGRTLRDDIEITLENNIDRRLLEIGGPGSKLAAGFTPGYFTASAGVELNDKRMPSTVTSDSEINHRVIPGDMLEESCYQDIDTWLDGNKVDCIISRMHAGIYDIPRDPFAIGVIASRLYTRLAPGGLLIAQVHPEVEGDMQRWKEVVESQTSHIDIRVGTYTAHTLVRLYKAPGAPESLPLIQSKEMVRNRLIKERAALYGGEVRA